MSGDNIIPFTPRAPRIDSTRDMERITGMDREMIHMLPVWLNGDVKFNVLYPALFAAGLTIKLDSAKEVFVITKK